MNIWRTIVEPGFGKLTKWSFNDDIPQSRSRTIESLPPDLLLEIANSLEERDDRLQFALASRHLYPRVIPSIYSAVVLHGYNQCRETLSMLCDTPTLARHVQSLLIYPDYIAAGQPSKYEMASGMCTGASFLVTKAALNMDALQSFGWHAYWGSPIDTMWRTLRRCCHNLRSIHMSFTERLPSPNSAVFMFNNLTSFSMTLTPIFSFAGNDFGDREGLAVYHKLWDMLVQHCPELVSLSIESDLGQPIYARRLLDGRWPHLRSLTLGPIKLDMFETMPLNDLNQFLEAHASLEQISLNGVSVDLAALPAEALSNLKHLVGSIDQFRALCARGMMAQNVQFALQNPHTQFPHSGLSESLEVLTLREPIPLRELTPLAVSSMLAGMHALTSLTAVFSLESGYDSNGVFRTIVAACPQMLHLDLTCTSKPSFYLEAFSRTLRGLARLRTLSLTVVKVPGDESMQAGAIRIAHSNPRLQHFTIAYIPQGSFYHGRVFTRPEPIHEGRFALVCDTHGIPITLFARERWTRWGWLALPTTRRAALELRPSGHPDAARKTWTQLLFERSPAGEEARLLMLSAWLLGLAAWGVAKSVLGKAIEAPWRTSGLNKLGLTPA